jgi:hypothetical protein
MQSEKTRGVASRGVDQNGEYRGTMDCRINVDLRRLFGLWEGLSVSMHARTRFGQDISADAGAFALPNTGMLMPAPGSYHGTDITGLVVNQTFPLYAGHQGLLTLGKLDILDAVTLFFPRGRLRTGRLLEHQRLGQRPAVGWRREGPLLVWRLAGEPQ